MADLAASIRARLLDRAREIGEDHSLTLNRFATERFLFRLGQTPWRENFVLKGALLFDLWFDHAHRPTRDADFLGFGPEDSGWLRNAVSEICAVDANDGLKFDAATIIVEEIRDDARYGGFRVRFVSHLGKSRCTVQIDIGFGDAVTPVPTNIEYPSVLHDFPSAQLRAYPRETVFSEKLEAIVNLGMGNSRMKDFYDLRALIREGVLDANLLGKAIAATFARRGTPIPTEVPIGLSEEFANDATKLTQWKAFLGKNRLQTTALGDVISELREFAMMVLTSAAKNSVKP